jgi:hypothetical protein
MSKSPNQAFFIAAQAGITPMAIGLPGEAKTSIIHALARALGRECYTLIGSIREPADIGGYPYLRTVDDGHGGEKVFMALVPPKWVMDTWGNGTRKKWVIFLDELTCCPPAVQAAMLRVIAERYVGDEPLPEDTIIVAACNPPGVAANGHELEPPMANRVCHLQWEMDWSAWDRGMMNGLNFPEPEFTLLPENWKDGLSGVAAMFTAFRKVKHTLFQAYPTKDRSAASGAWPSPRSWTNAATCRAAALSVGAEKRVLHDLLAGCVGEAAAIEFTQWEDNLDLPDPEEVLAWGIGQRNKKKVKWPHKGKSTTDYVHPDRSDKLIALLSAMVSRVLQDSTVERWEGAFHVIGAAAEKEVDVASCCAQPLARSVPVGAKLPESTTERIFPVMKRVSMASGV